MDFKNITSWLLNLLGSVISLKKNWIQKSGTKNKKKKKKQKNNTTVNNTVVTTEQRVCSTCDNLSKSSKVPPCLPCINDKARPNWIKSTRKHKPTTGAVSWLARDCHKPTEVHPGLWVCGKYDYSDLIKDNKVDVLVPLDSVFGHVWEKGFRGDIFYIPIPDFKTIPKEIVVPKAKEVIKLLEEGKRVVIFCIGGHGRTGYFASIVLGILGVLDPIKLLRAEYCSHAVESREQLEAIADILQNPQLLVDHQPYKKPVVYSGYTSQLGYGKYGGLYDDYEGIATTTTSPFVDKYKAVPYTSNTAKNSSLNDFHTDITRRCKTCIDYNKSGAYISNGIGYCSMLFTSVCGEDRACNSHMFPLEFTEV